MPSPEANEQTRREWRELGFHYTRDDQAREWLIEGSSAGLECFSSCLRAFALEPSSQQRSEHEHYGPYMYLEVMSWPEADVNEHCIQGTPGDLLRLSGIVARCATSLVPGTAVNVTPEYAPASSYRLVLRAHPPGTDPASLDPQLSRSS